MRENNYELSGVNLPHILDSLKSDQISEYDFTLSDRERLDFHVECNDYFATLATVLDLITQDESAPSDGKYVDTLKKVKDELLFLQKNYRITKK